MNNTGETGPDKARQRLIGDFLSHPAADKAGVVEIHLGASGPIQYNRSFEWPLSPPVTTLEYDSRQVKKGSMYFALPGLHTDGHKYIGDAVKRGASAVVHQHALDEYPDRSGDNIIESEPVLYIRVRDSRFAMSPIADAFYDHPSRRMAVIGVTGTEGKSTTVYLIYQLLKLLDKKAGFISTVQQGDGISEKWNAEHQTTPEALIVHKLLAEMSDNGAKYAVVESSSHGLSKKTNRLGDVDFDIGVMTNVTHEHLEFHGTWEQYRSDKAELFRSLDQSPSSHTKEHSPGSVPIPSFGVVNGDDQSAVFFLEATGKKTYTFSTKGSNADLSIKSLESGSGGNRYETYIAASGSSETISDQLPGAFNAGNVLAALLVVSNLLCIEIEKLISHIPCLKPVRGRMTAIHKGQPYEVLVDYAHTPSSFEAVLPPIKKRLMQSGGRLICLFGSPGERDTQKRALQGEVAARYADFIILTDEDPRGEDPLAILEEIALGCETTGNTMIRGKTLFLIPNRPGALRKAFSIALKGDVVLLLGKGHENSIIYAKETIAYDEFLEAETALEEAGYGQGTSNQA